MIKPRKPCGKVGCPNLTDQRFCEKHAGQAVDNRPDAAERGYGHAWRQARARYLRQHPNCVDRYGVHAAKQEVVPATRVDHIVPHKGNMQLFWDETNWQGLCEYCHNRKTATEDSSFAQAGAEGIAGR